MSEPVGQDAGIAFDGVWKKFRRGEMHDSLRDLVPAMWRRMTGHGPREDVTSGGEFWAVQDVSFAVRPGEALGIIGHNGAGKSTILKILTKILRPNRGDVRVHGRIGALIEVAAGFHQDLTGRENVFLQGAIMGMPVAQIRRKFDDIVDFAGIADFIDTPVKRYSSGMNARLGFAIAAHLDPDVLIIDEVLAVGDFAFQQRAFGRIQEMVQQHIPVVVVSHQLDRVATLCTKAILMHRGRVLREGTPVDCISAYVSGELQHGDRAPGCPLHVDALTVTTDPPIASGGEVGFHLTGSLDAVPMRDHYAVGFRVRSAQTGQIVFATDTQKCDVELPTGSFALRGTLQINAQPGIYAVETVFWNLFKRTEEGVGPTAYVQVSGGPPFWGAVQMNAALRLEAAMAHAGAAGRA